ncbi:glycosyltransferase family 2 protein [Capnocytophaga sputigena]|uniref:glycosyltransferase n=1 Tax=Capnocytophaga sputigena TaxID=1019 RepID=UPI0028E77F50|nr:glycosyltransferase family 2 protein [Capnocytophaga sputigena]
MNIGIVIPAYNEAESIGTTLHSLLNQTYLPSQIIVVDDGSTDNTAEVVNHIASKYPIVQLVQRGEKGEHLPGAKVVQTFNYGLSYLKEDIEVICKFDADLIFPDNYLEILNLQYSKNSQLGMFGGFCYIEKNGLWVLENLTNKDHLRGAVKSYRKACFEAIGGLKMAMGWDTADELLARYHGWIVQTDETLHVKHLRPTGAGYKSNARYLQGSVFYRMRYGVLLTLLAAVKLAVKKRSGKLFLDYCKGFYKAKQEKQPYLLSAEEGKWVRQYRWKGIFSKFYNR